MIGPHLPGGSGPPEAGIREVAAALSAIARCASGPARASNGSCPSPSLTSSSSSSIVRDPRFSAMLEHMLAFIEAGDAAPRYVSNSLHSCAKLRAPLGAAWWRRFWAATEPALSAASWNSQDCSNALWAVAVLGASPPPEWLRRFFEASEATLAEAVPQAISNTLYAAGVLSVLPPQSWLDRFVRESMREIPAASSTHASASASNGAAASSSGERLCLLANFSEQALGNTFHALGVLGWVPPPDWQRAFFQETYRRMPVMKAQELSNTVWALGQLKITPSKAWLGLFFADTGRRLGTFVPQGEGGAVRPSVPPAAALHFSAACTPPPPTSCATHCLAPISHSKRRPEQLHLRLQPHR